MKRVLSWFTRSLFALATVVGLYLAAIAINAAAYFWLVVGASVLVGLIALAGPKVRTAFRAWRGYPAAVALVKELQTEISESNELERALRADIIKAAADGRSEGRASAVGEILAATTPAPDITELAEYEGAVALVVRFDTTAPPVGARYRLVVETTRQLRGIVEVAAADTSRGIAYLLCVEVTSEKFWSALSSKVITDSSPPTGVVLEQPFSLFGGIKPSLLIDPTEVSEQEIEA